MEYHWKVELGMIMTKYFIFFLLGGLIIRGAISYIRVCYFTNWAQFVPTYRFLPNRIPTQLCTHVVFAYADIRATNVTPTEFNDVEMYGRLNRLKRDRPTLRTLLAVGGWAAGGEKFSRLVASETSMTTFSDNLIAYLRRNNFDGVNIDWQYPTSRERGSEPGDRLRFTNFLQVSLIT
uniref:GH18 domain-containing protein n=1 Tax=Biomphalaria glabrata TaxID=6526 RepID=A0A2C9LIV6_BIOGL